MHFVLSMTFSLVFIVIPCMVNIIEVSAIRGIRLGQKLASFYKYDLPIKNNQIGLKCNILIVA